MLRDVLNLKLEEIYSHGIDRLERLLNKESMGYIHLEDVAGIVGIILALAHAKSSYPFYRYKETEGDAFERYMKEYLYEALEFLRDFEAVSREEVIPFKEWIYKIRDRDTSIIEPKIKGIIAKIESGYDTPEADEYMAINRRWGISYIVERKFVKAYGPYYGYRIVDTSVAISLLKKAFENRLERIFYKFRQTRIPITEEGEEILKKIESITAARGSSLSLDVQGSKLYERPDLWPPCMQALLLRMKQKGHLSHAERFQLGTFLKRAGMDVETQLRFRYENAVDNVNVSRDDFIKHAGYIIEHVYGLRGSMKDYEVPKCERAWAGDYYCPFAREDKNTLRELLKSLGLSEEQAEEVVKIASRGTRAAYVDACMKFFEYKIGKRLRKPIRNPKYYLYIAARLTGAIKQGKKDKT